MKYYYYFGHSTWHVRSKFPDQGLNPPLYRGSMKSEPLGCREVPRNIMLQKYLNIW